MKRIILSLAFASLALPAPATAEIRSGTTGDPIDKMAPVDIVRASATYDTGGRATVDIETNNSTATPFFFSANIASYLEPSSCLGTSISIFGDSTGEEGSFLQSNTKGVGGASFSKLDDRSFYASASDALLSDKDYQCAQVSVSSPDGGTLYDEAVVFFEGYGPPVCTVPAVKGLTLAVARSALEAAACKTGQIKKPKTLKKGFKLVVSKVVDRADGTNKVDVTLVAKKTTVKKT